MKSHMRFRWHQIHRPWMTLNGGNAPIAELKSSYEAHHKNEDRLMLSGAKCRPMDLVSRNIKYMGMFVGTP